MKKCVLCCLLLLCPVSVFAHPHVFIDNETTFLFDEGGLSGIRLRWTFDEMFGATFIMDYDADGNGVLEPAEVANIKAEAFDHLKNYGYFTRVTIDGRVFPVKFVKDFNAINVDGQLIYVFTIPCHVSAAPGPKTVTVAVFDREYYTQVDTSGVVAERADAFQTTWKKRKNKNLSYYYDMIVPDEAVLTFRKES